MQAHGQGSEMARLLGTPECACVRFHERCASRDMHRNGTIGSQTRHHPFTKTPNRANVGPKGAQASLSHRRWVMINPSTVVIVYYSA